MASQQQVMDCDKEDDGCDGGYFASGMEYFKKHGIAQESQYPYTEQDGTCSYSAESSVGSFKEVVTVELNGKVEIFLLWFILLIQWLI